MTIDTKELIETFNTASKEIKTRLENMDERLIQVEVKGKRIRPRGDEPGSSHDPELKDFFQKGHMPPETKGISVTNDGQGVTVRSQWNDSIFTLVRETSPVREVANVITTDTNEVEVLVDRDEPVTDWIGELDARAGTDTSYLTRHKIPVHEHYALPEVTLQMLEDSQFDVEGWLQSKLATKFSRQEATAFVSGDGSGKPRGILDYGTTPEADFTWGADPDAYAIGAQYTGADGDITDADALFDLVDSLKAPYLPGAGWMMTRAFRNKVRKLKDSQDRYLLEPSLQAGTPDRLLGYPVHLAEDMPTLAADGVGALFGNFRDAYTVVDRLGITIQRDSVTKPGWVKYFGRRRVGGALTNPEAVKALVLGSEPA